MTKKEQTKVCSKCGAEKPINAFYPKVKGKYGVMAICKECKKAKEAAYRSDPEKQVHIKAYFREYRAKTENQERIKTYYSAYCADPEKIAQKRAQGKAYRDTPEAKERIKAQQSAHYLRNRERLLAYQVELRFKQRLYAESILSPNHSCQHPGCNATESHGKYKALQFHHVNGSETEGRERSDWWVVASRKNPELFKSSTLLLCKKHHDEAHAKRVQKHRDILAAEAEREASEYTINQQAARIAELEALLATQAA